MSDVIYEYWPYCNELPASDSSAPTEDEVLKAVYESGLHQSAPNVLVTKWKDGIDINKPSGYLMNFARKLKQNEKEIRHDG